MLNYSLRHIVAAFQYREIDKIVRDLNDLPYAIIKGEALALLAYKDISQRKMGGDIDFLIPKDSIPDFEKVLRRNGFCCEYASTEDRIIALSFSHQTKPYVKKTPIIPTYIDINYDIFWGEYRNKRISITKFLEDTRIIELYGCVCKTLTPVKTMIQFILHHYKEMNSIYHLTVHNCINYGMFKDVYYLWKNNQEAITLNKLYITACEYEIIPFVYYVLYYTNWIFKDYDLKKYVQAFETSEGVGLLDRYGLTKKEQKQWKVDFQKRLETENLYELIKNDLTDADIEKIERNRRIFG